jgi:transcriptional regulator with XRE-family HTH domain
VSLDLVIRLREARRSSGLSQAKAGALAGIHPRSISSWETGSRIDSMGIPDLQQLLAVYGMTLQEFFSSAFERRVLDFYGEMQPCQAAIIELTKRLGRVPPEVLAQLLSVVDAMLSLAERSCEHVPTERRKPTKRRDR